MCQVSCAEGETSATGCHLMHLCPWVCILVSCSPKASLLLCDRLCQTWLLGLTSKAAGSLLAVHGRVSMLHLTLNTCSQVPRGGHAPQLETGTRNLPPPSTWPVPPSHKPITWALGREETQEICTPLMSTGAQRCSGTTNQLLLQQLCRSMLLLLQLCKEFVVY